MTITNSVIKTEFKLKKTKLILGNGIDLHCGFKTSYNDYFNCTDYEFDNPEIFKILFNNSKAFRNCERHFQFIITNIEDGNPTIKINFQNINIWDIYFFLEAFDTKQFRWCDIEDKISKSFMFSINPDRGNGALSNSIEPTSFKDLASPITSDNSYWGLIYKNAYNDSHVSVSDYTENIRFLYRIFRDYGLMRSALRNNCDNLFKF